MTEAALSSSSSLMAILFCLFNCARVMPLHSSSDESEEEDAEEEESV
jgi:hypothetical protein